MRIFCAWGSALMNICTVVTCSLGLFCDINFLVFFQFLFVVYFRCLNRSNQCSKLEKYILFGNETSAQVTVKQGPCFNLSVIFHFNYKQMKVQRTRLILDKWCLPLIYMWDLETKPPIFIFIKMRGDLFTTSKHKRTEDFGGPELKYGASCTILFRFLFEA